MRGSNDIYIFFKYFFIISSNRTSCWALRSTPIVKRNQTLFCLLQRNMRNCGVSFQQAWTRLKDQLRWLLDHHLSCYWFQPLISLKLNPEMEPKNKPDFIPGRVCVKSEKHRMPRVYVEIRRHLQTWILFIKYSQSVSSILQFETNKTPLGGKTWRERGLTLQIIQQIMVPIHNRMFIKKQKWHAYLSQFTKGLSCHYLRAIT